MNMSEGYRRIEAFESAIAEYVMMGRIDGARDIAISLAATRDSMLTSAELLAVSRARMA